MNPVWLALFGAVALLAAAALTVWLLAGASWALGLLAAGLGMLVLHHVANLSAFMRWLGAPRREHLPTGSGVWETVLAELHRYLRQRDEAEQRAAAILVRGRAAGQALPDGVVVLDRDHRIEWANPTAEQHLGIDARRDAGRAVSNLLRNPDFVAYLDSGAYREPLVLKSGRGAAAVLSLRVIGFGDEQKLLLSRDITAQDKLDAMRRDFVANVSHELKTPVTVLSGFVETLADEQIELSGAQRRKFLGLMSEQAQRMRQLVEDLLTLSSLEDSNPPTDEQVIDMRSLIDKLAEEARLLSAARHQVICSVQTDARLNGSLKELGSAFSNLVTNAVRYTPQGGSVRIVWQLRDGQGRFSVVDSGIGIESRHIPRLTERFYRVDNSRSRETGGTGLGLAIVKHVLARHQASLEITSEFGRGSTFSAVFAARRVIAAAGVDAAA